MHADRPDLMDLARAVAELLPQRWNVRPPRPLGRWRVVIDRDTPTEPEAFLGRGRELIQLTYDPTRRRYTASGINTAHCGVLYYMPALRTVSTAAGRGPEALAEAITARLLPEYRPVHEANWRSAIRTGTWQSRDTFQARMLMHAYPGGFSWQLEQGTTVSWALGGSGGSPLSDRDEPRDAITVRLNAADRSGHASITLTLERVPDDRISAVRARMLELYDELRTFTP